MNGLRLDGTDLSLAPPRKPHVMSKRRKAPVKRAGGNGSIRPKTGAKPGPKQASDGGSAIITSLDINELGPAINLVNALAKQFNVKLSLDTRGNLRGTMDF